MPTKPILALPLLAAAAAVAGLAGSDPAPVPAGAQATAPPLGPLLGIVSERREQRLVRIDRATLRRRPGRPIDVGTEGCAPRSGGSACSTIPPWAVSPDRSRLALARHRTGVLRSLRLVDARRMRVAADIRLSGGAVGLLAWPLRDRLLAVQEVCCAERQRVLAVDVARRRVVAARPLGGTVLRAGRTARELVLLLAPAQRIGAARVAIVDARGGVRFVALHRMPAGTKLVDPERYRTEYQMPGLAVDPSRRRAFVITPERVAAVDLANGTVSYDQLEPARSLFARLRDWVEPVAYAKSSAGRTRSAEWLGGDLLAVTGTDESAGEAGGGRIEPAGLSLVDTESWNMRTIDRGATDLRVAGDVVLATGSSGLAAYDLGGEERFRRFAGRAAWIEQVFAGRAYVRVVRRDGRAAPLRLVDLATGRVAGSRAARLPLLVTQGASSWWDG